MRMMHDVLASADSQLILRGVSIVDVENGSIIPDRTVYVRGSKIDRIERTNRTDGVGGSDEKFLIPGLIDMHIHYRDIAPEFFVNFGVTSVRDTANEFAWITAQKRAEESGVLDVEGVDWYSRSGPRIFAMGVMNSYPKGKGHHRPARTTDEARSIVRSMAAAGADGIKLHKGITLDMVRAVSEEADACSLRVTAHLDRDVPVKQAVHAGLDGIEHTLDMAEHSEEESLGTVELMLRNGVYWAPTMVCWEPEGWSDVLGVTPDDAEFVQDLIFRPELAYLPDDWRRVKTFVYPKGGRTADTDRIYYELWGGSPDERKQRFNLYKKLVKTYVDGGGNLLASTDSPSVALPGFALHEEMTHLVEAIGLTPLQALQAATVNGARFLGKTDIGRIAVGAQADMVLLDKNPLADIRNTRRISTVIKRGKVVELGYHANFVQLLPRPMIPNSPEFGILERKLREKGRIP